MAKKNRKKKINNYEDKEERFSFDDEIVIGVTKKQEKKQEEKKQNNGKNKNVKKQIKTPNGKNNKDKRNRAIHNNDSKKNHKKKSSHNKKTKREIISPEEQEKLVLRKRRISRMVKFGTIASLLIIVIICAMFSPLFKIKIIEIEGNELVPDNEIISLSQIQLENNLFKFSKNKVAKQIKENAYIEEVTITRKLPSTVSIKVEERQPAYLLEYAGSYVYIDLKGYMLQISEQKIDLPILQGAVTNTEDFIVGNRLCSEDLEKLSVAYKIMELAKDNEINTLITGIDIENKLNYKLVFETQEKTAYLGDKTNMNTKILIIKSILEKENGKAGDILVNMDLNNENPIFRERV